MAKMSVNKFTTLNQNVGDYPYWKYDDFQGIVDLLRLCPGERIEFRVN